MKRFRADNTEGYTPNDLAALNWAFDRVMTRKRPIHRDDSELDHIVYKSWQDHVAEELLYLFDRGLRDSALIDAVEC